MNENDGLKPNDAALRLFFENDTLYITKEDIASGAPETVIPSVEKSIENPAMLIFEGAKNPEILLLFSHPGNSVMDESWGGMIDGLLYNEKAMNMKPEQIAMLNLHQNSEFSLNEILTRIPATKVIVWGESAHQELNALQEFSKSKIEGASIFKADEPGAYMEKEGKVKLWLFIKSKILA